MKSIKFILAISLILGTLSLEVINHGTGTLSRVNTNNKNVAVKKEDLQVISSNATIIDNKQAPSNNLPPSPTSQLFGDLFTDPDRKINDCLCVNQEDQQNMPLNNSDIGGISWSVPRRKRNLYEEKQIGYGPSAYLFDFLDDILQRDITIEFVRIWNEARTLVAPSEYKDPYTLESILGYSSETAPKIGESELINKIMSLSPAFSADVWKISLTCGQIDKILKEWGWFYDFTKTDPAKLLVDRFDFDGDGRLNPREFLLAMIYNNKKVVDSATKQRCKNCLEILIETKIDPIFSYMDCTSINVVSADDMWKNFRFLKRTKSDVYDIYKCKLENGNYRTSAVNDFLLKSHKIIDGRLNKEEFRYGLLTGYWDRHTDSLRIYPDDTKNLKSVRWSVDGVHDNTCERIQQAIGKARRG